MKKIFKFIFKFIKNNSAEINAVLTFVLIIVSVLLIKVTIDSISSSNIISTEARIQSIKSNVQLASDLVNEINNNEAVLKLYIDTLANSKNENVHKMDMLYTTEIQKADNIVGFGNKSIRSMLKIQIIYLDLLKAQINSANKPASKEKNVTVDKAIELSKLIYYGNGIELMNISSLKIHLENYILSESKKVDILEQELFKIISNS